MSGLCRFLNHPGLRRLHADERKNIESFLKSPAKEEFFFLLRMIGQPPAKVWTTIIDEFTRRFFALRILQEKRAAIAPMRTWQAVGAALEDFAAAADATEHRHFWDKMRHVVEALPRRSDRTMQSNDANASQPAKTNQEWNFTTCKFCWRRVAFNSGEIRKTSNFCFKHNLPSMHPLYRKHRRLEQQLSVEQQPIVRRITTLVAVCPGETESEDLLFAHLMDADGCLPRLTEYLNGVGHDGTHESLLWAFHGPPSEIRDPVYEEALQSYIQRTINPNKGHASTRILPIFTIDELSRAEAWLTLIAQDKR